MNPSPLTIICITLLSNELIGKEDIPPIIVEEVYHFYPLITGKELRLGQNLAKKQPGRKTSGLLCYWYKKRKPPSIM